MKKSAYPIRPILTEADYQAALQLVAPYLENEPVSNGDTGKHFEAMVALIEACEVKYYSVDHGVPTPGDRGSNT